jgi:FkbM family methyltransferase
MPTNPAEQALGTSIKVKASVPVTILAPPEMEGAVKSVLSGEYEFGYFGEGLKILDIGANVGSFAIWANLRWPNSSIYSYEPHPGTFNLLLENVRKLSNVSCHNVAVYPSERKTVPFWGRFPGDGKAGMVASLREIGEAEELIDKDVIEVPVLQPRDLPVADIMKLDVEGAEADIICAMDISRTSLILLEYHSTQIRNRIKEFLVSKFTLAFEDYERWENPVIEDDCSGRMVFVNKHHNRLYRLLS